MKPENEAPLPAACPEGVEIVSVETRSPADKAGLAPGDRLIRIGGMPVRDILDLMFLTTEPILELDCRKKDGGSVETIDIVKRSDDSLGIEIEEMRTRRCGNKCIFCFIDQNPAKMRETIYVKDEDFRLSFIHGNYITGCNLTDADLERIVEQRFSPLYFSVHATDHKLRCSMLGRKPEKTRSVMEILQYLKQHHIDFHCQIVLCPHWNDGEALEKSLDALESLMPSLLSVAVVPVGLTAHRDGLAKIEAVNADCARRIIDQITPRQLRLREEYGERIVLLADEFYLLADVNIPEYSEEERQCQIENGVGMVADFWFGWEKAARRLPEKMASPRKWLFLTGKLGAIVLEPLRQRLEKIENLEIEILALTNSLYGEEVTVSGLLAGRDFQAGIQKSEADFVFIPPNALRPVDARFLDDLSLDDLQMAFPDKEIIANVEQAIDIITYLRADAKK